MKKNLLKLNKFALTLLCSAFAISGMCQFGNANYGYQSLNSITSGGDYNGAFGYQSLYSTTTGDHNTGVGYKSIYSNTTGNYNTGIGSFSLKDNTTGIYNTSTGAFALEKNTTGASNSAYGYQGLKYNTSGNYNSAFGLQALLNNTTGNGNAAFGFYALKANTTGTYNTAVGYQSLINNTYGHSNVAVGVNSGPISDGLDNTIAIGNGAIPSGGNKARIGNSFITEIGGAVGWSNLSDGRFKKNIEKNVPGIEFINLLEPVTYNYDLNGYDKHIGATNVNEKGLKGESLAKHQEHRKKAQSIVYSGFVAQDVEKAAKSIEYDFSGVVVPQSDQDSYSLRYSEFVVPLVKATQEQQKELDGKTEEIESLKKEVASLKALVEKLVNNDPSSSTTETNSDITSPVKFFPNPTNGIFDLNLVNPNGEAVKAMVYNLSGELVFQLSGNETNFSRKIDLSNHANGSYVIKTTVGRETYQNKIILQK